MQIKKNTIIDIPILGFAVHLISLFILKFFGWKLDRRTHKIPKYIIIAAPHTSNWDFIVTILMAFALNIKIYVMAKKEITEFLGGSLFKWLGVIPINRSKSTNAVQQAISLFNNSRELIMIISPLGTRKKVDKWKTGFYYIACGANIPIALGFIDYGRKAGGISTLFKPTGNIDADMIKIKAFYSHMKGLKDVTSRKTKKNIKKQ